MKRLAAVLIVVAALSLTACTAPAPVRTPTATASASPVASALPDPAAPTQPPEVLPPLGCLEVTVEPAPHVEGAAELFAAALGAELPAAVILTPGVHAVESVEQPGMIDAVAGFCSDPMTREQLIEYASAIAVSIARNPGSDRVSDVVVTAWSPGADGALVQGDTVTTEYRLHTWDAAGSTAANWE